MLDRVQIRTDVCIVHMTCFCNKHYSLLTCQYDVCGACTWGLSTLVARWQGCVGCQRDCAICVGFTRCLIYWLLIQVQENCIDLVGRIADRGPEYVSAREWMRICFELLELLKAHKKAIRRATVNTFGYIAKAIGWVNVAFCLFELYP